MCPGPSCLNKLCVTSEGITQHWTQHFPSYTLAARPSDTICPVRLHCLPVCPISQSKSNINFLHLGNSRAAVHSLGLDKPLVLGTVPLQFPWIRTEIRRRPAAGYLLLLDIQAALTHTVGAQPEDGCLLLLFCFYWMKGCRKCCPREMVWARSGHESAATKGMM